MNDIPPSLYPEEPGRAGTMVVCPVVALSQWKGEVRESEERKMGWGACSEDCDGPKEQGAVVAANIAPSPPVAFSARHFAHVTAISSLTLLCSSQIAKFCDPMPSILVYHGPNRSRLTADLPKADIVLTTYQVLESDFRKMTSPSKIACPKCGQKYKVEKAR